VPFRWSLDDSPRAIGKARRAIRRTLEARCVPASTVEVIELLASEVVTNAIVHARSAPSVEMVVSDQVVRVAVEDQSDEPPQLRDVSPTALTGRGMKLVDGLSSLWGTERVRGGGKQVWFEVPFAWT
jgi:anti-sigma regulatory factor (Ser/Thr protein kinase)